MKVEIWSDVMCPFCYIGKRRFEAALKNFEHKDNVEITWKSFQLNPGMKTEPGKNINQYLAELKGWSVEEAKKLNDRVTAMAAEVGLKYNFDKAVVANSFDAHRLLQLAKKHGKGDAAEEALFNAYFSNGENIADPQTLTRLGTAIGLNAAEVKELLSTSAYADEVNLDMEEAQRLGVTGVPFFVIDRKYALSGAQSSETFLSALKEVRETASN